VEISETIIEQARVITALVDENVRWMAQNRVLEARNFGLIQSNATLNRKLKELATALCELRRKDAKRR